MDRRDGVNAQCTLLLILDLCSKRELKGFSKVSGRLILMLLRILVKLGCTRDDGKISALPLCIERRSPFYCSEAVIKRLHKIAKVE